MKMMMLTVLMKPSLRYLVIYMINTVPVKEWKSVRKHENNDPWITKGIVNACKKKNSLYKAFLRVRTKEAENKYKKYKNKLNSYYKGK